MRLLVAALLSYCVQTFAFADDTYCFSDETNPYNIFATKTAYEVVRDKKLKIGNVPGEF